MPPDLLKFRVASTCGNLSLLQSEDHGGNQSMPSLTSVFGAMPSLDSNPAHKSVVNDLKVLLNDTLFNVQDKSNASV